MRLLWFHLNCAGFECSLISTKNNDCVLNSGISVPCMTCITVTYKKAVQNTQFILCFQLPFFPKHGRNQDY